MSKIDTPTGWVETTVVVHTVKIVKGIMTVATWNRLNVTHPLLSKGKLSCDRCDTKWTGVPQEGQVNLCMMEKEVNRCICDACFNDMDPSNVIKFREDKKEV